MENLTSAVGVSTQDEAGLKPLQQLRRERERAPHRNLRGQLPLAYIISFIIIIAVVCRLCAGVFLTADCTLIGWGRFRGKRERGREGGRNGSRGGVMRLQSAHPLWGLLRQHVILLPEQQVSLCRRRGVLSCAAGVAHPVQRIVLEDSAQGEHEQHFII